MRNWVLVYFLAIAAASAAADAREPRPVVSVGDGKAISSAVAAGPDGGALLGLELAAGPNPERGENAGLDLKPWQRVAAVAAYTAKGQLRWSRALTSTGAAPKLFALAGASDGSGCAAGLYAGKANVLGVALPAVQSAGATDAFVLSLAADGAPRWLVSFGGESADTAIATAIAPDGGCYAAGGFQGSASFGGKTLSSHGRTDAYISRLDATGNVLWALAIGGAGNDEAVALAAGSAGGVYLLVRYTDSLRVDAADGTHDFHAIGSEDALVLRVDAGGRVQAVQSIGSEKPDHFTALTANSRGVAVVGYYSGSEQLRVGEQTLGLSSQGGADALILRLDAALTLQQHSSFGGGNGMLLPLAATYAPDGRLWLAGSITGDVQIGKETLRAERTDGVLLRFDAQLVAAPHSVVFGGARGQQLLSIAASSAGIYASGVTSNVRKTASEREEAEERERREKSTQPKDHKAAGERERAEEAEREREEGRSRSQAVLLQIRDN